MIKIHCIISGFREKVRHWHGSAMLVEAINETVTNGSLVNTRVLLYEWNEDWQSISDRLWWLGQHHDSEIRVNLYGYSWGAGWGAVRLANELGTNGVRVNHMVLCDPVYRHTYRAGNWRAFSNHPWLKWTGMGNMKIKIPPMVENVSWLRQNVDYPRAHDLIATSPTTVIADPVDLHVEHTKMDDHPEYRRLAREAAITL